MILLDERYVYNPKYRMILDNWKIVIQQTKVK